MNTMASDSVIPRQREMALVVRTLQGRLQSHQCSLSSGLLLLGESCYQFC